MQYPDLSVVQAETEGAVLKIDQVREVNHSLSLKPYQSKNRVALFLRFQEANQNAQNALLKTLEEAPSYAILILTADSAEQLLPTIPSRCEVLRLRALPIETVESHLLNNGASAEDARLLAHLSNGRPGYALRLLNDPEALKSRAERLDDLKELMSATRVRKFAYADKLARDKDTFRRVLMLWSSYYRDVMLTAAQATPGVRRGSPCQRRPRGGDRRAGEESVPAAGAPDGEQPRAGSGTARQEHQRPPAGGGDAAGFAARSVSRLRSSRGLHYVIFVKIFPKL